MSDHNEIIVALKGLTQSDLIGLCNDYFDSLFYNNFIKNIDAADRHITYEEMNSINDTYYYVNSLGKVVTFSHVGAANSPIGYNELAKWLKDNDLLDKYEIEIEAS